jgi:threonine 3-dehydrogenase
LLKGIYGREVFETWYKMTSLLQAGMNVMPVLTHQFHARDYLAAFDTVRSGACCKVILDWTS